MSPLLWRASARFLGRHPWQLALALVGVALGVAVVVAVDLANTSARTALELSVESLSGRATHRVLGGPEGLEEDLYRRLRVDVGARPGAPVVELYARAPEGESLHLLGVAPLAELPLRTWMAGAGELHLSRLMTEPDTALLAASTAAQLGVAAGDRLPVTVAGRRHELTVIGLLPTPAQQRAALEGLLLVDIATAQPLGGMTGRLSYIDLRLPRGAARERLARRIERALPAGARLVPAGQRKAALQNLTRAFHTNLTAMSLLALLVGTFLVYNTMAFTVLRRRPLIGTLRTLGMTRREVFALVTGEALVLGLAGTAAGLLLGVALAQGLVRLVARTINDLYFTLQVTELVLSPLVLGKGLLLGLGASLLAVLPPALEAARTAPRGVMSRSLLEERVHVLAPWLAGTGVALGLAAAGLLGFGARGLTTGFVALFLALLGLTLMVPMAVLAIVRGLARPAGLAGLPGRLAVRGVGESLSRTGVAIAALMLAVATTVGVGIMVASFRTTVELWLESRLQADLYVRVPALRTARTEPRLPEGTVEQALATRGVEDAMLFRSVKQQTPQGLLRVEAIEYAGDPSRLYTLRRGDPGAAWEAFRAGEAVLLSEPLAYRRGLGPGDAITLPTDRGRHELPVAGVFYDYESGPGTVLMTRALYREHWDDPALDAMGLYLAPGADLAAVEARLRERLPGGVQIRSNRDLRELSLQVFDRTFAITEVLRLLAVLVAFVGVLSALAALALERGREHAILRTLGFTPGQVRGLILGQTALMGLLAGLLALPVGLVLAELLVHVINRRAFGWSMPVEVPPGPLLEAMALAVGAAVLAGVQPARRMARIDPGAALRGE